MCNWSDFGLNRGAKAQPDRDITNGKSQGGLGFRNEESGQKLTSYEKVTRMTVNPEAVNQDSVNQDVKPAMTKQQAEFTNSARSPLALYHELAVGESSTPFLLWYELCTLLVSGLPGLLGLGARGLLYPSLFGACGKRPAIGRGTLIRDPKKIRLGAKAILDDYAVLDVRGKDAGITIGDHVTVGRFSILAAKGGTISLGNGVNIGSNCRIATQSKIEIGESTLIAAYAYIGPGNHQMGDSEVPLIARDMDIRGGVQIGPHVWIGTRATILDGVTIGARAIIGAHSLVKDNVPEGAIVAGTPARVIG